jgi:hypothetical protein
MDSYLNIVSLALAIAALVPVLVPGARAKLWTISAAALSLIILVTVYQFFVERQRSAAVTAAKADIVRLLKNRPMTFEQIYDSAYYRDFGVANLAIDELVEDGVVTHKKKETTDATGRTYVIREFALPPNSAVERDAPNATRLSP